MPKKSRIVRFIPGSTDILVIAPHGVNIKGVKKDDANVDILARQIANKLGCAALINNSIKRSQRNYNSIAGATNDKEFIKNLRGVLDIDGPTLVVWVHGIGVAGHKNEKRIMKINTRLDCLIGYGQPDRHSADENFVKALMGHLQDNKIIALPTRGDAEDYRGRAKDNMNQWFRQQKEYNDFSKVQSIQIEFSLYRRRKDKFKNTAKSVSAALEALIRTDPKVKSEIAAKATQPQEGNAMAEAVPAIQERLPAKDKPAKVAEPTDPKETASDEALVDKAYGFLKGIFVKHFHNAMLEAGEYIISEFFGGDYERARNPRNAVKIHSLNALIRLLQENSGHAPSKTWVYDAVKLAIDEHHFKSFSVYGKLGHSHKVLLTRAPDNNIKRQLAEETVEQKYTAAVLRERIKEVKNGNKLRVDHVLTFEELIPLEMKELERLRNQTSTLWERLSDIQGEKTIMSVMPDIGSCL